VVKVLEWFALYYLKTVNIAHGSLYRSTHQKLKDPMEDFFIFNP